MRRSAVDLPDPLEQEPRDRAGDRGGRGAPESGPPPGNADDLLAQLAGEEVDRLLAEAREDSGPEATPPHGGGEVNAGAPAARPPKARVAKPPATPAPLSGPVPSSAPPGAKPLKPRSAAAPPANPNDAALDDLFRQLSGDGPAGAPPNAVGVTAIATPAAARLEDDLIAGTPGAESLLEQTLTARAQELIDEAQWEAEQDRLLSDSPEAAAHRASFAAAAEGPAAEIPVPTPVPASGEATPARAAPAEPPSAAAALAAEMEEDERIHAGAVARLAHARDSVEVADTGKPSGLEVTGVAVIGGEVAAGEQPATPAQAQSPAPQAAPAEAAPPPIAVPAPAGVVELPARNAREPLLVRLLEWLNAPLANLSDGARAALGKAAIATTVNALAVLLYVLVFRR